jgi:hypothetical protein
MKVLAKMGSFSFTQICVNLRENKNALNVYVTTDRRTNYKEPYQAECH